VWAPARRFDLIPCRLLAHVGRARVTFLDAVPVTPPRVLVTPKDLARGSASLASLGLFLGVEAFAVVVPCRSALAERDLLTWAQQAMEHATPEPQVGAVAPVLRQGNESSELRTLRLAEEELFGAGPGKAPPDFSPDCSDGTVAGQDARARLPKQLVIQGKSVDLGFLRDLKLPGLPVRWDRRLLEYLVFFREDPRGRDLSASLLRRAERYGPMIRRVLAQQSLPQDLLFVAMIESGFDPEARSSVDARGMWQFVKQAGESYELRIDRWADERLDPEASTLAAAKYMHDLHARFGTWDLAFASYNMGYGALLRAVRKYNTNDYGLLARVEAGLPFETTLYVSKIIAMAIVARNPERFGHKKLVVDAPIAVSKVQVPEGTTLQAVATASGVEIEALRALNPHLLRDRIPPGERRIGVYLPKVSQERFQQRWPSVRGNGQLASHALRFGEALEDVARRVGTSVTKLRDLNELEPDEVVPPGTALLIPATRPKNAEKPDPLVVAVPERAFRYRDRRQVFYRVTTGDSLLSVARVFDVTEDELTTWNNVVTSGSLPKDLILQVFVRPDVDLSAVLVFQPHEVRALTVGTEEFFEFHESQRGRVRIRYRVQAGDTVVSIGKRFDLSPGSIGRINQFGALRVLVPEDWIVLYVPEAHVADLERRKVAVRTGSTMRVAAGATRLSEVSAKAIRDEDLAEREAQQGPLRIHAPRPADILGGRASP
jgi:membrane-bound lytic murein transglycosylase D